MNTTRMDTLVRRSDVEDGMRRVQEVLYDLTSTTFYEEPVVLHLRDGLDPDVYVGVEELQATVPIKESILKHLAKRELCVYCVINDSDMIVIPIGEDIPLNGTVRR